MCLTIGNNGVLSYANIDLVFVFPSTLLLHICISGRMLANTPLYCDTELFCLSLLWKKNDLVRFSYRTHIFVVLTRTYFSNAQQCL